MLCIRIILVFQLFILRLEPIKGEANDDGCLAERNSFLDTTCKSSLRARRSEFKGPAPSDVRTARQVFSRDVENTRHVVDRREADETGFKGTTTDQRLWPGGEVSFYVDESMSDEQRCLVYLAMDEIEFASDYIVKFKCASKRAKIYVKILLNNEYATLKAISDQKSECFLSNDDCYSKNIGRYLLDNEIRLSPNSCFHKMTIVHELLHVLGFYHEHARYDRDEYVEINYAMVEQFSLAKQFDPGGSMFNQKADSVGYDYESVLHYPDQGLMQAKKEPTFENTRRMGWYYEHDEGLSPRDKIKLQNLYRDVPRAFVEDKLLITMPTSGRHVRPVTSTESPDPITFEEDDGKNWINQQNLAPPTVKILESTGRSYSEAKLIEKVSQMYSIVKDVAEATNQTEWMYERLVDVALTQLTRDLHMLVLVGERHEKSWEKVPVNDVPKNYRENHKATEVERTNFQLDDGKVEVMVVVQERPKLIAKMDPPCNCQPSYKISHENWQVRNILPQSKLVDIQQQLDQVDAVRDWSAVATKPNTAIYDSYFPRCICTTDFMDPVHHGDKPTRVYTWRAFYGYIHPPYQPSKNQPESSAPGSQNGGEVGESVANDNGGSVLGTALGVGLNVGLGVPIGLILAAEMTTTTTVPCVCNPAQITVDRGTVSSTVCLNGQQAQITCNVTGAKLFQTTVNTAARFTSGQDAYSLGTAPTCSNGVWQTQTVFKCRYCPTGYSLNVDDYCIKQYTGTSIQWPQAQAGCAALGQNLITVRYSTYDANFFNYIYPNAATVVGTCFWTGRYYTPTIAPGNCAWESGYPFGACCFSGCDNTFWFPGQPDQFPNVPGFTAGTIGQNGVRTYMFDRTACCCDYICELASQ